MLVQEHHGRRDIYHIDAYRLRDEDEFLALGPEEFFESDALTLIEWADRVQGCLPNDRVEIHIEVTGAQVAAVRGRGDWPTLRRGSQPTREALWAGQSDKRRPREIASVVDAPRRHFRTWQYPQTTPLAAKSA